MVCSRVCWVSGNNPLGGVPLCPLQRGGGAFRLDGGACSKPTEEARPPFEGGRAGLLPARRVVILRS